jgi:predicted membrane protein
MEKKTILKIIIAIVLVILLIAHLKELLLFLGALFIWIWWKL